MYCWQVILTLGQCPIPISPCQRQYAQTAPIYSTCCWFEVLWGGSQTDKKKAGRGTHGCIHKLQTCTHPHAHLHKYGVHTDMYSYLQVSSLNFKLLFVNSVSPIFPFWNFLVFFLYSVDLPLLFIFFNYFFLFVISSVSLPSALCFTHPHFWSLQLWITLNFSQPSLSALPLHDTSQCNWHQLNMCKVLQPVIEKEIGKLMIKWWKVISDVLLHSISCSQTSFIDTHTHVYMDGTHTRTENLPPKWPIFICLT